MPTSDPQSVDDLLTGGGSLERIVRKAQALMAVNKLLREILPSDLAPHCRAMNLYEDTLVLQVDNAAVATRIRYESHEILQSLRFYDAYRNITKIVPKIRPN